MHLNFHFGDDHLKMINTAERGVASLMLISLEVLRERLIKIKLFKYIMKPNLCLDSDIFENN